MKYRVYYLLVVLFLLFGIQIGGNQNGSKNIDRTFELF